MYINNGARTGLARVTLHCLKVNFRAFAFPCFFLKFYLFVINVYGVSALCGMDTLATLKGVCQEAAVVLDGITEYLKREEIMMQAQKEQIDTRSCSTILAS